MEQKERLCLSYGAIAILPKSFADKFKGFSLEQRAVLVIYPDEGAVVVPETHKMGADSCRTVIMYPHPDKEKERDS